MCWMMVAGLWPVPALGSLWWSYRRRGSQEWVLRRRADRSRAGVSRESAGHPRTGIATGLVVAVAVAVAVAIVVAVATVDAVNCGGGRGHPESGTKSSPVAIDSLPVGYT